MGTVMKDEECIKILGKASIIVTSASSLQVDEAIDHAISAIETLALIRRAVTAYFNDDDMHEMELIDALTDWSHKGDMTEIKRLAGVE